MTCVHKLLQAHHAGITKAFKVPGVVLVGILVWVTACVQVIVGLVAVQVVLRVALHPHDWHTCASLLVDGHCGDAPDVASLGECSCEQACNCEGRPHSKQK